MKCYYVVTSENIPLEYNMQEMCNWMWCIIVEIYSIIVGYAFTFINLRFTIVDYNITIEDYNFTLWDYILNSIENIISFSRL